MGKRARRYDLDVEQTWVRDRGVCWLCRLPVPPMRGFDKTHLIACGWWAQNETLIGSPFRLQPTRDHVVAFRFGGRGDKANIRLAHRACNNNRHAASPGDIRASIISTLKAEAPRRWLAAVGLDIKKEAPRG